MLNPNEIENFVPYPQALALKDMGYDIDSDDLYFYSWGNVAKSNQKYMNIGDHYNCYKDVDETACFDPWVTKQNNSGKTLEDHFIYAPLYQEVFKWFRRNYNLVFSTDFMGLGSYYVAFHLDTEEYRKKIILLRNACYCEIVDIYNYDDIDLEIVKELINIVKRDKLKRNDKDS